ncbi:hypothetical protein HNR02_001001 [Amycolatopsis endophytica]|uniref:TNT domain-containing protein n=1 Tax=Amycolatopsis endophytica TaxID=860233 RepID=A0A853AY87_9PSEU|nr:glycohydrolase toxin TNT-related protein [Amycolatopsis endophytica]NYI87678.1 hypothetical protein [Amycolatopsis endophytica]
MAQPTTQLNATEQDTLVKQIGLALLRAAPRDWRRVTATYRAVGRYHELTGEVVLEDGSAQEWMATHDIATLFGRLRGGMYREGRGTWFNARYQLDHPSSYNLEYDRDEPRWDLMPPPQAYADELRMFPRSEDNVPEWLMRRMAGLAPEQPGPRFRLARIFDGHEPGGRPVLNRPDLDNDEQHKILEYLNNAPVVRAERGFDLDRLAQQPAATVPVAFHTDGTWIWPAAVNYYLQEYGVAPEAELVAHIAGAGYALPEVPEQTVQGAAGFLNRGAPPRRVPEQAPPPPAPAAETSPEFEPRQEEPEEPARPADVEQPTTLTPVIAPDAGPPTMLVQPVTKDTEPETGPGDWDTEDAPSGQDEPETRSWDARDGFAAPEGPGRGWDQREAFAQEGAAWDGPEARGEREGLAPEGTWDEARGREAAPEGAWDEARGRAAAPEGAWGDARGREAAPEGAWDDARGREAAPEDAWDGARGREAAPEGHERGGGRRALAEPEGSGGRVSAEPEGFSGRAPAESAGPGGRRALAEPEGPGGRPPAESEGPGGRRALAEPEGPGGGSASAEPEGPGGRRALAEPEGPGGRRALAEPDDSGRRAFAESARPGEWDASDARGTREVPPGQESRGWEPAAGQETRPAEPRGWEREAALGQEAPGGREPQEPRAWEAPGSREAREPRAWEPPGESRDQESRGWEGPGGRAGQEPDGRGRAFAGPERAFGGAERGRRQDPRENRPAPEVSPPTMLSRPVAPPSGEPALDNLRSKLSDLGVSDATYRIGEPAEHGWSLEKVDEGWRVGWYDETLTSPAVFGDADDAAAFMLGKLMLDAGGRVAPPARPEMDANEVPLAQPQQREEPAEPPRRALPDRLDEPEGPPTMLSAPPVPPPVRREPPPRRVEPAAPAPAAAAAPASAASGGGNQQWPIQPMQGEPPLTLFRGKEMRELPAGSELDRFGGPAGNLLYAAGTPFEERSLVPEWVGRPYHVYRVQRPLEALAGVAIPWFNQPGGGAAYLLPASIEDLLASGDLIELDPGEPPID